MEPGRELRHRRAAGEDASVQILVLGGEGDLGTAGHHGDGVPAGPERVSVEDPFDTRVHTADDGDPGCGELVRERG